MSVPYLLILLRGICAVSIPVCAASLEEPAMAIVALIWIGLISDIFDGVIARRMGIVTARLRRMDSQVDVAFWLSILGTSVAMHSAGFSHHILWIGGLLVMEAAIYAVNFARFGRAGSTHAYSAKLFGLSLLAGFTEVFLNGEAGPWFHAMLIVGTVAQLEGLAIACALRRWRHDVKSIVHVWRSDHATSIALGE